MAGPLFFADNLFNAVTAYPLHLLNSLDASTVLEVPGFESWRVADGRRTPIDYCTWATPNLGQALTLTCDRARSANCLVLDRGHNLAGFQILLQISNDGTWTAPMTLLTIMIPTVSAPNNINDTTYGVVTEEGAWACYFPTQQALYWRIFIPAMGVGIVPKIVGAFLGMAYVPTNVLNTPWSEDQDQLVVEETASPWAWRGRSAPANPRSGAFTLKLYTDDEYDVARTYISGHYGHGRPMWICYDMAQADRMFMAIRPTGTLGFAFQPRWFPRQIKCSYVEHEVRRP